MGNAVLGLAPVAAGHISFEGRDLSTLTPAERRRVWREIQVAFRDPVSALNPRLTIKQSIAEPLVINDYPKAQIGARVDELMALVGLNPDQRDRRPGALSGGQRQRIVIARALALNPKLVICDEPVSALDVSIQSQILNLLMRLQRELGLSYLFIAHDLSVVRHIADRVAVMHLGVFVEEGPAAEIFCQSRTPLHPYTEALLSAIPAPDPTLRGKRKRIPLEGDLPSPLHPPKGLPFCHPLPRSSRDLQGQKTTIGRNLAGASHPVSRPRENMSAFYCNTRLRALATQSEKPFNSQFGRLVIIGYQLPMTSVYHTGFEGFLASGICATKPINAEKADTETFPHSLND